MIGSRRRPTGPFEGGDLMTDLRHTTRLAALVAAVALIVTACGGSTASPSVAASSEPSAAPSVEPSTPAAPSEVATSEAPASREAALPSFDLSALSGNIPGADSYRVSFSVGGEKQYESVVVTKPEVSKEITLFDSGEVGTRIIVIGTKAWMATGADGAFEVVPTAAVSGMLLAFDPTAFVGAYAQLDWAGSAIDNGTEQKNGVSARHLRIDSTTLIGAAAQLPAGAAIDIWVANEGYLVAWETTGLEAGQDVAIEISNVNDPANEVKAPS